MLWSLEAPGEIFVEETGERPGHYLLPSRPVRTQTQPSPLPASRLSEAVLCERIAIEACSLIPLHDTLALGSIHPLCGNVLTAITVLSNGRCTSTADGYPTRGAIAREYVSSCPR